METMDKSGLQIFKNNKGSLGARFVGPSKNRVKYIASKLRKDGVYYSIYNTTSQCLQTEWKRRMAIQQS